MISMFRIFTGAPYIKINAEKSVNPGNYQVSVDVTYPGENGTETKVTQTTVVKLQEQVTQVTIKPKGGKIRPAPTTQRILLDDEIEVEGPVVHFELDKSSDATLFDRLFRSDIFSGVSSVFDRAVFAKDMIFGYKHNVIYLSKNEKLVGTFKDVRVVSMNALDSQDGFFALVRPIGGVHAMILAAVQLNDEWKFLTYSLGSLYVEDMVFHRAANDMIMFAAYDSEAYMIKVSLIQITQDGHLTFKQEMMYQFEENLIDFDLVKIKYSDKVDFFFLVYCEEQTRLANFMLFKLVDGSFDRVGF